MGHSPELCTKSVLSFVKIQKGAGRYVLQQFLSKVSWLLKWGKRCYMLRCNANNMKNSINGKKKKQHTDASLFPHISARSLMSYIFEWNRQTRSLHSPPRKHMGKLRHVYLAFCQCRQSELHKSRSYSCSTCK